MAGEIACLLTYAFWDDDRTEAERVWQDVQDSLDAGNTSVRARELARDGSEAVAKRLAPGERFGLVYDVPVPVSGASVGIAFGVSLAVGVFFGLYPARKAADMNIVDSLSYE